MSVSSSNHLISIDPRVYCETMNELHSYITSSTRGYLTQAELFRYYRQRHDNKEIPYRTLGYRSLLDLLGSDHRLFAIDLRREPAYVYSAVKLRQQQQQQRRRGNLTIYRQHHSTNLLGERTSPGYDFFVANDDHHVPFQPIDIHDEFHYQNEQTPVELHSASSEPRPSTPDTLDRVETSVWKTPQLVEQEKSEESNEKLFVHEPIVLKPLPPICLPFNKENIPLSSDENNKRPTITEPSIIKPLRRRYLRRSISTSTSSLSTFNQSNSSIFLFIIIFSLFFVGAILYKIC